MFCDQDDVWLENKIELTLNKMKEMENLYGEGTPLLVFTDLKVVDEGLNLVSDSYFKFRNLSPYIAFKINRLLVQNVITGCTIMINDKLKKIMLPIPEEVIFHDWWVSLVALITGKIGYLNEKTILYRQHSLNASGGIAKFGIPYIFKRIFEGGNRVINDLRTSQLRALFLLDRFGEILDYKERNTLQVFSSLKELNFIRRKFEMLRRGFFKSGILRNIFLFLLI